MIEIARCGHIPFASIAPYFARYSKLNLIARQDDSIRR